MHKKTIIKIGALIINDNGELMAVHKKGKPEFELIVPGGKIEGNESDEETLRRELREELNVNVSTYEFYGEFEAQAIYEDAWLIMRTYRVVIHNQPQPSGEIDKIIWLDQHYQTSGYQFASILGKQILPNYFQRRCSNVSMQMSV